MPTDEQQIRALVSTWISATQAGDIDTVLGLMTDDIVFLIPGRAPMSKSEFASLSRVPPGTPQPKFAGTSEIQEIQVLGDWAFMWTRLSVSITPPGTSEPIERAGHTLSIVKKVAGKWLLARDANLLAPVQKVE
jgi:uncharacterized protein (TIGR02246 family)